MARWRLGTAARLALLVATLAALLGDGWGGVAARAAVPPAQVWAWGWDGFGQLGDGAVGGPASDANARQGLGLGGAVAIAAGNYHSLALLPDGGVLAWGDDTIGQLGDSVIGPDAPTPQRVGNLGGVAAIAAGGYHNLALLADGTLRSWGRDTEGQLGDGTVSNPDARAVPNPVRGLDGVIAVAAGYDHSLALRLDGTVWAWGNDYAGQVGDGVVGQPLQAPSPRQVVGLDGVIAIAGGHNHSLALKADGTVWAWGRDDWGQLGDGAAGGPIDSGVPRQVANLGGVVAIAAGESHSLALRADGGVWGWGANSNGQLGIGGADLAPHPAPVAAATPAGIVGLAAGRFHSLALLTDGGAWSWGNDEFGELGDGTIGQPDLRGVPAPIVGLGGATAIAAGADHSLAIAAAGPGGAGPGQVVLAVAADGPGGVTPGGGGYALGSTAILTATPAPGAIFLGWSVDGRAAGWANPLTLTLDVGHGVVASFAAAPAFADVPAGQPYSGPVAELAARGIVNGYGDGRFGPSDPILRAQMAALIARAMSWRGGPAAPFSDRCDPRSPANCVDDELWASVGALADPARDVARGYGDPATCAPAAAPCYAPRDPVLYAQTISFITRAMVAAGRWQPRADDPALYPNVPAGSGHRADLATFVANAGPLPDFGATNAPFGPWNAPTTRGWFARALWQALNSTGGR